MSETIGELVIPGTYIEVRAEGLIGVGGIATGNIGVVGTANRGPLDEVVVLGSYGEALETFGAYDRWPGGETPALSLTRTLEQLFKGGASSVYAVRVANLGETTMASTRWDVTTASDQPLFGLIATSPGTWAEAIQASIDAPDGRPVKLTLELGSLKEVFAGATAGELADEISRGSRLVVVGETSGESPVSLGDTTRALRPTKLPKVATPGGPDGAAATTTELAAGLALLEDQPVNIVAVGGFDANTAAGTVLAHLEQTENDGRERIAILGASSDATATIISDDVAAGSNRRLVLVAPGIKADDAARTGQADKQVELTAPYAAALVAGKLSTLAPHISLTNKDLASDGVTTRYTRAQQKQLLLNRVLVLHQNLGIRVLRGISTDTGAFTQISVRRIVDFAKAGVRIGSNPYIGRLNNSRVRAALKATLDGFLSQMVVDEMLTAYTLDVGATRSEEINGIARVTMTLQPTFSIDFVKVIMNLQ